MAAKDGGDKRFKLTADIVEGFVGSVLAKRFDGAAAIPQFHRELWELACSDSQFVAVAAPRNHAKSTAGTLAYGLAELLFRSSRYLVIVSDTETQAAMFVASMKQEITENEQIGELFGLAKDEKGRVLLPKDTEADFVVQCQDGHQFRVTGKGAEQKLRGMLWNGSRPDLVIVDDLENDELVMNKDRRDKLKRWFNGALIPALALRGKLRMWGTILHMDSVLENLMPPNDKYYRESDLKVWSGYPWKKMWKSIKYRAHNPDFSQILWKERFTPEFFRTRQKQAALDGLLDQYSQEWLNNPLDDSIAYFKRGDFLAEDKEDKEKPVRWYIACDPAVTTESRNDYTVFVVAGMDDNRVLHVRNVIRERLDGREIVDTILSLQRVYEPDAIGIEQMMITKSLGPFLREEMVVQDVYPNIIEIGHGGKDKIQRAKSIQGRMRARTIKFDKTADWYAAFEDELIKFPRGVKDDQVDAFAYLGLLLNKMIEAQTKEEIYEIEYEDEKRQADPYQGGRNMTTGY